MRIYEPEYGETRVLTWSAFLPVTINGETRWFEMVTARSKYYHQWINAEFVERKGE